MNANGKLGPDERPGDTKATPEEAPTHSGLSVEPDIKLDATAQALIGQQLRAIYDEIRQQEIPDDLLRLLDELERKERQA